MNLRNGLPLPKGEGRGGGKRNVIAHLAVGCRRRLLPSVGNNPAGGRGARACNACQIVSRISSRSRRRREFQKRSTLTPRASNHASRTASAFCLSGRPCCKPSSSISRNASTQKKSRMYGPKVCCRRNLYAEKRRSRNQ